MKRLLICLVALIAVFALVMPASAAEMKVNGIWNAKAWARDNYDGDDDTDDATQYVTQRFRSYWNWIASENLKLVYKNEIDMEWGDGAAGVGRNTGGGLGGDQINLETKNVYLEFMVPNTPLKFTGGLQGMTLHRGWMISDDIAAARFDINLDPFSILAYWGLVSDKDFTASSDDVWQAVVSGSYKAENMDGRISFGYEKGPNEDPSLPSGDPAPGVKSDDFYILMGDFGISFDMVSFFIVAGGNFGKIKGIGGPDKKYVGTMVEAGFDIALDIATIRLGGKYVSGESESSNKLGFRGLSGMTYSWAEIPSDGYFWEVNSDMAQIGGANTPNNMWVVQVGADFKPTDTTTVGLDLYYIGMDVKRNLGVNLTNDIGTEIDFDLTQKIYDNFDLKIVGAYIFAGKGYGSSTQSTTNPNAVTGFVGDQDNAYILGLGFNYKF